MAFEQHDGDINVLCGILEVVASIIDQEVFGYLEFTAMLLDDYRLNEFVQLDEGMYGVNELELRSLEEFRSSLNALIEAHDPRTTPENVVVRTAEWHYVKSCGQRLLDDWRDWIRAHCSFLSGHVSLS